MKAIGRNLIIKKQKEGVAATKGGLLLAEKQREDIRYIKASNNISWRRSNQSRSEMKDDLNILR